MVHHVGIVDGFLLGRLKAELIEGHPDGKIGVEKSVAGRHVRSGGAFRVGDELEDILAFRLHEQREEPILELLVQFLDQVCPVVRAHHADQLDQQGSRKMI